ncbi:hypothetical protein GDO81_005121 [Engystomops pustulosus]|uniref:SH2 domain-containing protein n=1 Tax=Engystomops pustulosus TaxID=76066 RepID=A0AAV7CL13_ENGPU|nr:hypothetical protein GDO81_005121 [Engystomops pustulosus]
MVSSRSFVVSKQPSLPYPCKRPLIIKTSTQFLVTARFLVNFQELRHRMKVSFKIDKYPAEIKGYRRFNLLGSQEKDLEYTQCDGLAVEFKHLTLKEQRAGGGGKGSKGVNEGSRSVQEELHIITLMTQFSYDGVELNIEATTLPFVVISNQSQFVRAWASILWFNLLSTDPKDVAFFSKPPAAKWILVADVLSWQFSCCTGRGLNADQLQMLGKKLCGTDILSFFNSIYNDAGIFHIVLFLLKLSKVYFALKKLGVFFLFQGSVPNQDSTVTWSKFAKESMPRVSFTFWEWFDAILTLVKAHLENIWKDGYVMGFVSRSAEDALLRTRQQGTFLLRFSESMRDGGITISWVDHESDGKVCQCT